MVIDIYRIRLAGPPGAGCADRALRAILAAELGHEPQLAIGPNGKPELVGGGLAFNVAHSGELALIAISRDGSVGVDLEQHRPLRDAAATAGRFFTAPEAALVAAEPVQFFRLWCRKEAWLKAQGIGLRLPLDTVDVRGEVPGWLLADLDLAPGYAAAVAREGEPAEIRVIDHAP